MPYGIAQAWQGNRTPKSNRANAEHEKIQSDREKALFLRRARPLRGGLELIEVI
jgi:hypothetical protein